MGSRRRITYLRVEDAPRLPEFVLRNAGALSDLELLTALLATGQEAPDALRLADRLLDGGGAPSLGRWTPRRLRTLAGEERAACLIAALELGRRALRGRGCRVMSTPRHVREYASGYATADREHFLAIHLNTRHVPHHLEIVSVGTLSASLVHPREVFRRAIAEGSANLILVHNHPSGDPSPSADDIEITTRLVRVGELVGIDVLDHVIITAGEYFSFREEGLIGDALRGRGSVVAS
jgi:DNA repair protein RadC